MFVKFAIIVVIFAGICIGISMIYVGFVYIKYFIKKTNKKKKREYDKRIIEQIYKANSLTPEEEVKLRQKFRFGGDD